MSPCTTERQIHITVSVRSKSGRTKRTTTVIVPLPGTLVTDDEVEQGRVSMEVTGMTHVAPCEPGVSFTRDDFRWEKKRVGVWGEERP